MFLCLSLVGLGGSGTWFWRGQTLFIFIPSSPSLSRSFSFYIEKIPKDRTEEEQINY